MLQRLYGVLLPFFVSFLLAYIIDPFVDFIQIKLRVKNRVLSVLLALVFISLVLFGAVAALTPVITSQVKIAWRGLETYFSNFDIHQYLTPAMRERWDALAENLNIETFISFPEVQEAAKNLLPKISSWISGGLSLAAELVVVFIGMLYLLFLLIDFPDIKKNWQRFVPERIRPFTISLVHDMDRNMNAYFRGQASVALIVGILFAIGFTVIGMPMGIAMGLIIGVLNLVPYMQTLGIPPCVLLCLVQSMQTGKPVWLTLLLMTLVFVVVQTLQDMVLTPKIMGKVTGLSPAAILLSLSIWGALLGFIGMIIALPLTTLLLSYYKHYILKEPLETEDNSQETQHRKQAAWSVSVKSLLKKTKAVK